MQVKKSVALLLVLLSNFLPAYDQQTLFNQPDANGERAIVVVIASYNNKDWYRRNLDSVFNQQYNNYRIIYVDDCSPDGTGDLVEEYVKQKGQAHRVTVIKNKDRRKALANIYFGVQSCKDNEIVALVDGDDFLAHNQVFHILNQCYAYPSTWLTYSQFVLLEHNAIGWGYPYPYEVMRDKSFRSYSNIPTHLRTFYAGLFKKIKLEDLMLEGGFFTMTYDMAIMLPMVEMASNGHIVFIPDTLYIYNDMNSLNDHKVDQALQVKLDKYMRTKKPYQPLMTLF